MTNYLGRKLCPEKKPCRPIRKLGRLGKLRAKGKYEAGQKYLKGSDCGLCQSCGYEFWITDLEIHHKQKCSQGGNEAFKNLVALCRKCHGFIHVPGFKERVSYVAEQEANVENGRIINWQHHTNALTKWRLSWI